ncbi:MAG: TFIIB-type zinc ribbon-containing protein [Planctomycetota bacterium]|jgi:phage FluMu protein Com
MAITFHCEHCGKKIEAADTAGGKWGKCPACHNKLYVPSQDTGEELKLAPLNESDLEREKRLMAETYQLTQDILQEREIPDGPPAPAGAMYELGERELRMNIISYLRQMAEGELDEAERTAALIAPSGARAVQIIDRIALSEIPDPELADIPQQMLSGAIRALRDRLG